MRTFVEISLLFFTKKAGKKANPKEKLPHQGDKSREGKGQFFSLMTDPYLVRFSVSQQVLLFYHTASYFNYRFVTSRWPKLDNSV